MDKTLESFLHPHRKPNVKFHMDNFDGEFEMKAVSAQKGLEIDRDIQARQLSGAAAIIPYVAEGLVKPDLHNAALLEALSAMKGHKILSAYDACVAMFTDAELAALAQVYDRHVRVTAKFEDDIETAKN